MGFFSSLKRNTEIIKAETDLRDISGQIGVIRRDVENGLAIKKETVQNVLDRVNNAYRVLHNEMMRELDNNTLYSASMYPNLTSEVKLLEDYKEELKGILETKFPEENA